MGSPKLSATTLEVNINVVDINDNSPMFNKTLYQASVNEISLVDTMVVTVTASDKDLTNPNKVFQYSMNQPLASQFFKIDPVTGVISVKQKLDYEVRTRYDFAVTVTDQGKVPYSGTTNVEITVTNFHDEIPRFNPLEYNRVIPESTPVGTELLTLVVIDSTQNLTFSIQSGNENGMFILGQNDGILVLKKQLDRETLSSYVLKVTVSDGFNSADTSATIRINSFGC